MVINFEWHTAGSKHSLQVHGAEIRHWRLCLGRLSDA